MLRILTGKMDSIQELIGNVSKEMAFLRKKSKGNARNQTHRKLLHPTAE